MYKNFRGFQMPFFSFQNLIPEYENNKSNRTKD